MSKLTRAYRDLKFGSALKRFRQDPQSAIRQENDVIADLVDSWGNQRWSALDEYLIACLKEALDCQGHILECGSGLTTILLGMVAQETGNLVWSLEHSAKWGRRTAKYLDKYGIESVRLNIVPLKDYGEFSWYETPFDSLPEEFALVVCDGPPRTTPGGRYGLLPIMHAKLRPDCVILCDDWAGEEDHMTATRWQKEFGTRHQPMGSTKPFIHVSLIE